MDLLQPVQVRVQVQNYDASVETIDHELEVLKETVDRAIKMLREDYSDHRHLTYLPTLEALMESDMTMLRRFHVDIIGGVTNTWKGSDGWYELDDMSSIAESWAFDAKTENMPDESKTSTVLDDIDIELRRMKGY